MTRARTLALRARGTWACGSRISSASSRSLGSIRFARPVTACDQAAWCSAGGASSARIRMLATEASPRSSTRTT